MTAEVKCQGHAVDNPQWDIKQLKVPQSQSPGSPGTLLRKHPSPTPHSTTTASTKHTHCFLLSVWFVSAPALGMSPETRHLSLSSSADPSPSSRNTCTQLRIVQAGAWLTWGPWAGLALSHRRGKFLPSSFPRLWAAEEERTIYYNIDKYTMLLNSEHKSSFVRCGFHRALPLFCQVAPQRSWERGGLGSFAHGQ